MADPESRHIPCSAPASVPARRADPEGWPDSMEGRPREACGVVGIFAPGLDVARVTLIGLYALQHRGQESAGIATSDGTLASMHKGMGLANHVFAPGSLSALKGHLAIGHTRYSTTGASHVRNAQPYLIETALGPLAVAHNGNLINARELRARLLERGVGFTSTTDSEVIAHLLAAPPHVWRTENVTAQGNGEPDPWIDRIQAFMAVAEGAYSLTILTRDAVFAVRDPHGFRPLCLGLLEGHPVVVSESCALQTLGAQFIREVEPGEIVRLGSNGMSSFVGHSAAVPAFCIFEHIYFARADSVLEGQMAYDVRIRLGRQLARESPADAELVVGVPDSARPAAIGYSLESGIPYGEGLIRNNYVGRTFIEPGDHLRRSAVYLKYAPLSSAVRGKRIVLVDDSIVRGDTAERLVSILREAGAAAVHMRICSPPVRHPCFMGIDMGAYQELLAHRKDVPEMCTWMHADSLGFLSTGGMIAAVHGSVERRSGYCTACFSGQYPAPIPQWLAEDSQEKFLFEGILGD